MSLAANRPINWNVLFVGKGSESITEHNLAASDYATEHGARVLALTVPFSPSPRICFDSGFLLDTIPGLGEADGAPPRREEGDARVAPTVATCCARPRCNRRPASRSPTGAST